MIENCEHKTAVFPTTTNELQTYELSLVWHVGTMRLTRQSEAQAIGAFKAELDDMQWDYHDGDIVCKGLGYVEEAPEDFLRTANYRGLPFARIGTRVSVDGDFGWIVGKNSSANFDVLFEANGAVLNCHPHWMMDYYDRNGELLHSSLQNKGIVGTSPTLGSNDE